MSSIRKVQTEKAISDAVYSLFSEGERPLFSEVAQRVAQHFAEYPAGSPLPIPKKGANLVNRSDVEEYNRFFGFVAANLGVLYEVALGQVEDVLELTGSLQEDINRLTRLRRDIERRIDDNLLSIYNTDGYFIALSDSFVNLDQTDLGLTSASIDTESGSVFIPALASSTQKLSRDLISTPSVKVTLGGSENPSPYTNISPFSQAINDGETNTAWIIEVETDDPTEVIAVVTFSVGSPDVPVDISRIDLSPYGSSPVQMFINTASPGNDYEQFGSKIRTSNVMLSFNDEVRACTQVRFTLRKTEPDYVTTDSGSTKYKYIFGAKGIALYHQSYERDARFISSGLYLPETDSGLDYIIDAVSLTVEEEIPAGTKMEYYVAEDNPEGTSLEDFDWRPIVPVTKTSNEDKVVRFDGSNYTSMNIGYDAEEDGGVNQIPLSGQGVITNRNPSPSIIVGADVYKIAKVEDAEILSNSVSLLEGVNTVRVLTRKANIAIPFRDMTLNYWAKSIRGTEPDVPGEAEDFFFPSTTEHFGLVSAGNGFFYGGDVGKSNQDLYVETYVDCPKTYKTFVSEFQKNNARSKSWDVRVFHNGQDIGYLPSGTDRMSLPWKFNKGLNHIALLIRIPPNSEVQNAYAGSVVLMADKPLSDMGTIRLDSWSFVDFFDMQFNDDGVTNTFTIHDGYLITRRKPTTNYLLKYALASSNDVQGLRFRADMSRDQNTPNVTPRLDEYRLRFSFG